MEIRKTNQGKEFPRATFGADVDNGEKEEHQVHHQRE